MAMVAPTVELAEYYTSAGHSVYMYAFNHHKQSDPEIYQARHVHTSWSDSDTLTNLI